MVLYPQSDYIPTWAQLSATVNFPLMNFRHLGETHTDSTGIMISVSNFDTIAPFREVGLI